MKENQRVTITKKMLKDSLLQLLKEKDLDHITVKELCANAQINRTTFYRYYKFPEDVLAEMEKELVEEMRSTISTIKTEDEAKYNLTKLCQSCYDKDTVQGFFMRYDFDADHAKVLGDLYNSSKMWQYNGYDADDEFSKIVGTYFAGGSYFIIRMWVMGDLDRTPEEMASLLWKLMTSDYSVILKNIK